MENSLQKNQINRIRVIEKYCKGEKVLDLGCGSGRISDALFKKGYNVEGIDISKMLIEKAKKRNKNIKFSVGDANKLTLSKKYDTIILYGILEYLQINPSEMLEKLKNNLKENGRIIIGVPNTNSLRRRLKHLLGMEPVDDLLPKYQFTKKRVFRVIEKTKSYRILVFTSPKIGFLFGQQIFMPDFLAEDLICAIEKKSNIWRNNNN